MKIAIIGAGPSGLAAANEFTKKGFEVDVFENDDTVGGLAKCLNLWGHEVEMGPHFLLFHTQNEVKELLENLLNDDVYRYDRLSRIYLDNKFYDYPPRPFNLLKNIGPVNSLTVVTSVVSKKLLPAKNNNSVESYVKNKLGDFLYTRFFKNYTEKLWGIPCSEISDDYAKSLIGFDSLNITTIIKKIFADKNVSLHRQCIYPKQGMGLIWSRLKNQVEEQGGAIHLSTNIKSFVVKNNTLKGLVLTDGKELPYDYVFSSIPEAAILRLLPNVPKTLTDELRQIKFRRVILVYLYVEHVDFMEDNTIYIYSPKVKAARITNYNRFKNLKGNDIIMCEYWTSDQEEMWTYSPEQMLAVVKSDLQIFNGSEKLIIKDYHVVQMKNAYPVPDMKLANRKVLLADYLKQFKGLQTLGRANQKNFNFSMETAMLDGINSANQLISQANSIDK